MNNRVRNEKGMILPMVLMLMAAIAILGMMAINISTIDIQIFGYQKRSSESLEVAQGGVDASIPVIENTLIEGVAPDFSALPEIILSADIAGEVLGQIVANDDINNLPDVTVRMAAGASSQADIDRLYARPLSGGAMEFAGGYEGVGASSAGGGVSILYRIRSEGFR